ncbi:c-type cytochrome [Myxococcus landrumensis]|uniref:C-type cytochrome n=1 Tax=Myxococcus landrumensis TaxID=2813577 RepID=A0ABX7NGP4_9BACT|nr:c-type cytochrome [Myxococcus landrumus]QSQ17544.1 c-type cytochrome [Myxococcus landrumus]
MKRLLWMCFSATVLVSNGALASEALSKAKNCSTCHSASARLVGPSYKEISAKYGKQKDAEDKLAQRVQKGSSGVWGIVPMPANKEVSDAEARALVKWIMSQK